MKRRVIPNVLSLHYAATYLQFSLSFKTLKTDKSLIQNETYINTFICLHMVCV